MPKARTPIETIVSNRLLDTGIVAANTLAALLRIAVASTMLSVPIVAPMQPQPEAAIIKST